MTDRHTKIPGNQIEDRSLQQIEFDLTNTPTDGQIIKINMPTGDMTAIDFEPSDLNISAQTAEDFLIYDGTNWVAKGGVELRKVGTFTRDITIASGTQAVTNVGFKPSSIIFIMGGFTGAGNNYASWAMVDGTPTSTILFDNRAGTAGDYGEQSGQIINVQQSAGSYLGTLSSFDTDGFTISWTKNSSPTDTISIGYIAFR